VRQFVFGEVVLTFTIYPQVLLFLPHNPTRKLPKTGMDSSRRDFRFRLFLQVDGFRALMVIPCDISRCSDLAKRRAALVATLEIQESSTPLRLLIRGNTSSQVINERMHEARCLLMEKLIKAVVTLPLNTLYGRAKINPVRERCRGPTEVVLFEGIRHLEATEVSQFVTNGRSNSSHG
jgi:hypothetical protein